MLVGAPNCKSHLNHKVLNFTDFDISVQSNEIIFLSDNPHIVHFWVLEMGAEQKRKRKKKDQADENSVS